MREPITVREAGRLGGIKRREMGADYVAMGMKGGAATKARHGSDHYRAIGKKGGEAVKAKGVNFTVLSQKAAGARRRYRALREEGEE